MEHSKHIYQEYLGSKLERGLDAYEKEWLQLSRSYRGAAALRVGWKYGLSGNIALGLPVVAFSVAHAPRGELLGTAAAEGIGLALYPASAALCTAALAMIPGVGLGVAALAGSVLGGFPSSMITTGLERSFRWVTQQSLHMRRVDFGRNYQDTPTAYERRLRAVTEMSGVLGVSRRYLGNEAAYLHR